MQILRFVSGTSIKRRKKNAFKAVLEIKNKQIFEAKSKKKNLKKGKKGRKAAAAAAPFFMN